MNFADLISAIKTSPVEKFGVVYHGADHKTCVGVKMIASGDAGSIHGISLQKVMDEAFRLGAKGMTLMHNHPRSSEPEPSEADLVTTYAIHDFGKKHGIPVLNHIIYGADNSAFSFIHNGIQL